MQENEAQVVIQLLNNLQRDTAQIKTDLAVNTTKTAAIEDHLKTLNGKVVKQEERMQKVENATKESTEFIKSANDVKRRRSDSWRGFLEKILLVIIVPLSIAIWQAIQYLVQNGAFHK